MNRTVSFVLWSSRWSRGRACTWLPSNNTSPAASSSPPAARGSDSHRASVQEPTGKI